MSTKSEAEARWARAEASLPVELRPLLRQFSADYRKASEVHVPNYKGGGPSAEILADLIRQGWRKQPSS